MGNAPASRAYFKKQKGIFYIFSTFMSLKVEVVIIQQKEKVSHAMEICILHLIACGIHTL